MEYKRAKSTMRKIFLVFLPLMVIAITGCNEKNNAKNPFVGDWVMIDEATESSYAQRFVGVETYFNIQDNGKMVEYLYNGTTKEAVWDNGVLSGEGWLEYSSYS